MLESLGVALFCSGLFICVVAYAIIVVVKGNCGKFLASIQNDELSYLSQKRIDQRVDGYLYTLVSVISMLIAGTIAMIIGMVIVPGLFHCLGMLLMGLYGVVFVHDNCEQFFRARELTRNG